MAQRNRQHVQNIHGLLVVDKPLGWSSMDVVRRVRHAAGGAKTGHAGTLDPLATGIVVCCLGRATRSVSGLMTLSKVYETAVDLSAITPTDDAEGEREEVAVEHPPSENDVSAALATFVGDVQQTPPAFSAIHVKGQRAYKMARRGEVVQLEPRTVHIDVIELTAYDWPIAALRVVCGKGTYIRSIARDLGQVLGTGGYLTSLRRTTIGPYDLASAVDEQRLTEPLTQADLLDIPAPGPPGDD
jgi:tRNA pseudouridine55 synthase